MRKSALPHFWSNCKLVSVGKSYHTILQIMKIFYRAISCSFIAVEMRF